MAFDFGLNLKNIRITRGLSIPIAAKRIGCHRTTLQNYENNIIKPSIENLEKLADLYACDVNQLLGRNNYEMVMIDLDDTADLSGLDEEERKIIQMLIHKFREKKQGTA